MSKVLALTATLALLATGAAAEGEDEFARSGPYIGIGLPLGINTFEDDLESDARAEFGRSVQVDVSETTGIVGLIGYRIFPYFAFEIQGEYLIPGFDSDEIDLDIDIEPIVGTANAKVFFTKSRLQPWLAIGAGAMYTKTTVEFLDRGPMVPVRVRDSDYDTAFALRFGGGFDYYATEIVTVSMGASYVLPFGSLDDFDYVTLDLMRVGLRF